MTQRQTEQPNRPLGLKTSRRGLLKGTGALAAGLAGAALIGCGDDDDDDDGASTSTPMATATGTAATPTPTPDTSSGGTVTAGVVEPIGATLIPALNEVNWILRHGIFDSLILQGQDWTPELLMAEEFEFSSDFTGLHVRLKPDIEFHNGRPFTSDDVRKTIQFFQRDDVASQLKLPAKMITDIQTPDDRTVELTFDAPRPFMTDTFAYMPMLDYEQIEGEGYRDIASANGTGPYKLAEFTTQVGYTVEAYPNYYLDGQPYLDAVVAKIIPDSESQLLALQSGEVQHLHAIEFSQVKTVEDDENLKIGRWENGGLTFMGMVVDYEPLTDPKVRQAISYALDRERFAEIFLEGLMVPKTLLWAPGGPGYFEDQDNVVSYDPERSRALLAEAGYADGLTLPMVVGARPDREIPAQLHQEDLADVGITLELDVREYSDYLQQFRGRTIEASWPSVTGATNVMHPGWVFSSDQMVRVPNASHFESEEYIAFLDRITQLDPSSDEAIEKMRWFNELFQEREPWVAGLTGRLTVTAAAKELNGFEPAGGRRGFVRDWWLS